MRWARQTRSWAEADAPAHARRKKLRELLAVEKESPLVDSRGPPFSGRCASFEACLARKIWTAFSLVAGVAGRTRSAGWRRGSRRSSPSYPPLVAPPGAAAVSVYNGASVWLALLTAPRAFLARQRQRLRRLKRRVAAAGAEADRRYTPLGVGGARVCWLLPPPPSPASSKRSGSRISADGSILRGRERRSPAAKGGLFLGKLASSGKAAAGGGPPEAAVGNGGGGPGLGGAANSGIVGHVWVSLKLRDPSMLLMRVVRQWNMARDEASVQQRRAAQLEAKRCDGVVVTWGAQPALSVVLLSAVVVVECWHRCVLS